MSLKKCVVCIAGDIRRDVNAPNSWEDADIERWFKQRDMTLIWREMNKSVTHLVIERAAFKANHAAVRYVKKDKRKKKAKIVTYDWLEDSLFAGKAIEDVSAYDPGKPRDIAAMLAAYPKPSKTAKSRSASEMGSPTKQAAPEGEGSSQAVEVGQQGQTYPKDSTSDTSKLGDQEKRKGHAMDEAASSIKTGSNHPEKQLVPTSGTKARGQKDIMPKKEVIVPEKKDIMPEKSQFRVKPAVVADAGAGLSWEARNRPRVFCDKTDQFKYCIELTHKEKPGERWILQLLEAPKVVDRAFLFRAYQYNAKNKIDLREDQTPPSTFQKAFGLFTISFHSKMRYPWDERLVRARDDQPGKWRYRLPAKGEPTGKVPPEFDPGHPNYVKPKELVRIVHANPRQERSVSEMPYERRSTLPDKNAMYDRLINKEASKTQNTCARAQKGKVKDCYRSKARKSAAPISLKRRREESAGPERRSKINKTGSGKFKSSEFVEGSDSDSDSQQPSQHKPRP